MAYPATGAIPLEGGQVLGAGGAGFLVVLDAVDDAVRVETPEEGVSAFPAGGAGGTIGGDVATVLGWGSLGYVCDGSGGFLGGGVGEETHGSESSTVKVGLEMRQKLI